MLKVKPVITILHIFIYYFFNKLKNLIFSADFIRKSCCIVALIHLLITFTLALFKRLKHLKNLIRIKIEFQ